MTQAEPFAVSTPDAEALRRIAAGLPDPSRGLPDPVFEFAMAVTPMINVDLAVFDAGRRLLLAWRDDAWGQGWHVPGGIIRWNEPLTRRIGEVARLEIGRTVKAGAEPLAITEFFGGRGHFISLLYACGLDAGSFDARLISAESGPGPGDLRWFGNAPDQPYPVHTGYIADVLGMTDRGLASLTRTWPGVVSSD